MKKSVRSIIRIATAAAMAFGIFVAGASNVKADEAADAALLQQQAVLVQQQAALLAQQQAVLAQYQAALIQQQQQVAALRNQAALTVYNGFVDARQNALPQALMLQQMQNLQYQQYHSMLINQGLDYQPYLLDEYGKYQQQALNGFVGYYGLQNVIK